MGICIILLAFFVLYLSNTLKTVSLKLSETTDYVYDLKLNLDSYTIMNKKDQEVWVSMIKELENKHTHLSKDCRFYFKGILEGKIKPKDSKNES